jgi:hypothetical protein
MQQPQSRSQVLPQPQPVPMVPAAPVDRQEELRQQLKKEENLRAGDVQQSQPQQVQQSDDPAPVDWLTPKVYKGSSNF